MPLQDVTWELVICLAQVQFPEIKNKSMDHSLNWHGVVEMILNYLMDKKESLYKMGIVLLWLDGLIEMGKELDLVNAKEQYYQLYQKMNIIDLNLFVLFLFYVFFKLIEGKKNIYRDLVNLKKD